MKQRKGFKKTISLVCALCLMLSMLGSEALASSADDRNNEEVVVTQAEASDEGETTEDNQNAEAESPEEKSSESSTSEEAQHTDTDETEETRPADVNDSEEARPADVNGAEDNGSSDANAAEEPEKNEAVTENAEQDESAPGIPSEDQDEKENEASASADEDTDEEDSVTYNTEPIKGEATEKDVTVEVTAPVDCFPEGTNVVFDPVDNVDDAENRVGFDITFADPSGGEVQPANEQGVSVLFSIGGNSSLLSEDGADRKITVYHKKDDGTLEQLETVIANEAPVEIEITAYHFSEYGVISETMPSSEGEEETKAAVSANLIGFLQDVVIHAPTDENGNYVIDPGSSYEMTLKFGEREELQFDDKEELTYDFPEGVLASDVESSAFSLTVEAENGSDVVSDNIYEVAESQLKVRFNQDDPNFERLAEMSNIQFEVSVSSMFSQNAETLEFSPAITKKLSYTAGSLDEGAKRAATRASDKSSVFHATITTNNDTYESGTTATVSVKYTLEQGTINPGDFVIMTIPESIASSVNFSLNSQHFSSYEYMGGGQYRLVFGEGVETGLSGSFSAFVLTSAETTTTDTISVGDASTQITVIPGGAPSGPGVYTDAIMKDASDNPGVSYGGYDYSDGYGDHAAQIGLADLTNGGTFKYRLYVNNKEATLSNVTVIDQLPDGMTFNSENGFEVMDAHTGSPIDSSLYSIRISGKTIRFTYPGEFNNRIQINYWVDIPAGSNQSKYTNTATITYTQDGNVYQEHRNYVLQGTANSASNGEKSVDKTEISTDPADQFVTYTIKFWNSNGFDIGDINLIDELDPYVRFVSASPNEYFSVIQDSDDPQNILITNTAAISESMTVYVRFIVDMTNVPEGYTVENTVGGNTTKTTKDVSLQITAAKTVDGETPGERRFDFELCDADGNVLQTKQNNAAGDIVFDSLDYSADDIGTHTYTIREKENLDSSYTQDTSVYTVTVTVSRTETGSLTTDVVYSKDNNSVYTDDIIFNNTSQTISVNGTKTWIGDNESVRPDSIVVYLMADGEMVDSQTVTAATDWAYTFDGLQKYKDGVEIQYSVTEEPIGGYQPEINGYDIKNIYAPAAANLVLGGTKTFEGFPEGTEAPVFTYTLSENGTVIDTKTTQGAGEYQFDTITYVEAGTHVYTVKETKGTAAGVTYDETEYTLTVEVADNGSGTLIATVAGEEADALDFTNSYQAAPASVHFSGTKTLSGKELQDGEFSFTLTGSDGTDETVTNDGEGRITFSEIRFDKAGTYTYEVKENATDEAGVTIDSTVYSITVEVTDDGSGRLTATATGADITALDFANTYKANSTSIVLGGTKTFEGFPEGAEAPVFTYTLSEDDTVIDTKTTQGAGSYQFDSITYEEAGHHVYTVKETKGTVAGVTYDETEYSITVEVTDDGSGQLEAAVTGADITALDFANTYQASSTSVHFSGTKTLSGKELQDGEFSFTLTGSDGTDETVTNDGEGRITFSEIRFDKAGTYTYEVKENATDEAGVTIDSTVYSITVEVTDDGSGRLVAKVTGADITALNFVNTYKDVPDKNDTSKKTDTTKRTKTKKTSKTPKTSKTSSSPRTGDENNPLLYIILIILAGGGIAAYLFRAAKKRKENNKS